MKNLNLILKTRISLLSCLIALLLSPFISFSQNVTGYVDQDRNGVNDYFFDANGDGKNDVTNQSYPHHFLFEDKNGDGLNDLWQDTDGDGVNDLLGEFEKKSKRWVDLDGDGIMDEEAGGMRGQALKMHVLDMDGDGLNDITGQGYSGKDLKGYRYGLVNEEMGMSDSKFSDENGDGMNDRFTAREHSFGRGQQQMDIFIDKDGDGVADDRGMGVIRGKGKKKGKK